MSSTSPSPKDSIVIKLPSMQRVLSAFIDIGMSVEGMPVQRVNRQSFLPLPRQTHTGPVHMHKEKYKHTQASHELCNHTLTVAAA